MNISKSVLAHCWHSQSSLWRLLLSDLAIHLSWQRNHIIFLPIDDHCHQTSSCPITFVNSTHCLSSCRSKPTPPSVLSFLIQSPGDFFFFCLSATASINHSHLLSVQLLDLVKAWFELMYSWFLCLSSLLSMWGKRSLHGPIVRFPDNLGALKAHHLHPRCSRGGCDL